jgi:putative aminopeptidase FrvX
MPAKKTAQPALPELDYDYLLDFLVRLLRVPSPTGYTADAIALVEKELKAYKSIRLEHSKKGALLAYIPGAKPSPEGPRLALTGHVDTLGAMVRRIKSNGRLELINIGGLLWNAVETENCIIHTRSGKEITGSLMPNKASGHVYGMEARKAERTMESMEVRLDERVSTEEETRALGISEGDFVSFDPAIVIKNDFIRSRFLDDKAAVAIMLAAIQALHKAGLKPAWDTVMLFSNYEEVGTGGSSDLPESLDELVAIDMAAIGDGQTSDEFNTSICVKDGGGPYHHGLTTKLRDLADLYSIPHKVDIYTNYGSDAGAYWRAGGAAAIALIGPGVEASHHYERTHKEALVNTTRWVLAYLLNG